MNNWTAGKNDAVGTPRNKLTKTTVNGHQRLRTRFAAALIFLTMVLLLISVSVPPPTGYAAAFPGQNGRFVITFSDELNIETFEAYLMDADDGSNLELLTTAMYYPAWSPDGGKIAFSGVKNGKYDIYLMDADGSGLKRLTKTPKVDEVFVAWSPDGKKLALTVDIDGNFDVGAPDWSDKEIYIMDVEGDQKPKRLTHNKWEDYGPAWSPDGEKIAFETYRDDNYEIYVMDADGTNQVNLTNNPHANDGFWAPTWSPDGEKIAFASDKVGNWKNYDIYVMDADGSNRKKLTNNPAWDGLPVWSPDGKKIAFKSVRDGDWDLYVMNADGSGKPQNITNNSTQVRTYDWQSLGIQTKN